MNYFDLTGKTAVVIGGAGGLGQAIAQGLVQAGAKVMISSRREEALQKAQAEIKAATGEEVFCFAADASNEAQVEALVQSAVAKLGKVTILVNSQGLNTKIDALEFDIAAFRQMLEANVTSVMISAKHFGRHFKENGYGKIVNLSSVRGKIATKGPGNAGYCATKGAVDMMTKQLASEFGQFGVTVNGIGPGVTVTPMMTDILAQRAKAASLELEPYLKSLGEGIPMRRLGTPEDLIGTAIFLSSPASDFITGSVIYPDGGLNVIG